MDIVFAFEPSDGKQLETAVNHVIQLPAISFSYHHLKEPMRPENRRPFQKTEDHCCQRK